MTTSTIAGVRWTAIGKYLSQAIELGASVFVARFMPPDAYGLLGMVLVVTGLIETFRSLGVGPAIVQRKDVSPCLLNSLFLVNIAMGLFLCAGLTQCANLVSWAYQDARVGPLTIVMSVSFIFTSLSVVPASILNRNLEFKRLALVDLATAAARVVTILTMAILGWGVWSLVGCTLVGVVTNAGMLFLVSTWRPRIEFSLTETRQVMGFGANVTGFSIVNFMARNADNLLIGRFLGATQLGYYSLAYRVLLLPRDTVTVVLMQVLFPKLSKSQDNDAELKNIYLRACGGIALVTFPMMLGVMVVAEPLVHLVLGPPWLPAVPLIQVLAPLGMLQSILATIGSLTLAKGRSDVHLRVGVAFSSIVILSFAIGLPFGVIGVACAYSIACLISCIPMFAVTYSLVADLRVSHLAETIFPAFCCALAMAIAVVIFRTLASQVFGAPVVLCSSVLTGIITYVSLVRFFQPPAYTDIAKLLPARFSKALGIS